MKNNNPSIIHFIVDYIHVVSMMSKAGKQIPSLGKNTPVDKRNWKPIPWLRKKKFRKLCIVLSTALEKGAQQTLRVSISKYLHLQEATVPLEMHSFNYKVQHKAISIASPSIYYQKRLQPRLSLGKSNDTVLQTHQESNISISEVYKSN